MARIDRCPREIVRAPCRMLDSGLYAGRHADEATARPRAGRGSDPSTVTLAPAVTRAAAILGALADAPSPVALSDLARRLGLPKSSVANICMALLDAGLIRRAG